MASAAPTAIRDIATSRVTIIRAKTENEKRDARSSPVDTSPSCPTIPEGGLERLQFRVVRLPRAEGPARLIRCVCWNDSFRSFYRSVPASCLQRGDEVFGVATDPQGNPVITGRFNETVSIGGPPLISAGGSDILLAKLSLASGAHLWSAR